MNDDYLRQRLAHHWQHRNSPLPSSTRFNQLVEWSVFPSSDPSAFWMSLTPEEAEILVLALKDEFDRQTRIGWQGAFARAEQILAIGIARGGVAIQALGTMCKGDALKLVMGRLEEAWDLLGEAGTLYLSAPLSSRDRNIGWARTRVGRVYLCVELGRSNEGYEDASIAQVIFEQNACWDRLLSLSLAWGSALINEYRYRDAITLLLRTRDLATQYPEAGNPFLSTIFNNLAVAARGVGQQEEALRYFHEVEALATEQAEPLAQAVARLNIALIQMDRGNYRTALLQLLEVEPVLKERYSKGWVHVVFNLVECYNALNQFDRAQQVGRALLDQTPSPLSGHQYTQLCLWLAQGEVKRQSPEAAQTLLQRARDVLAPQLAREASTVLCQIELEEAQIALQEKNIPVARKQIEALLAQLQQDEVPEVEIRAWLVASVIAWESEDFSSAYGYAHKGRALARRLRFAPYEYEAYLHLGKLAEEEGATTRARRYYSRSLATLARVYRGLSFTLHAGFLSTRQSGFHRLMNLELINGNYEQAYSLLEQGKNYLFWDYLQRSNRLKWRDTPETRLWREELSACRSAHRRLLDSVTPQTDQERRDLEQHIRALTERLYLYSVESGQPRSIPPLKTIQTALPEASMLLAFYEKDSTLWLFCVTHDGFQALPLAVPSDEVRSLLARIQENTRLASQTLMPDDWHASVLAKKIRQLYTRLGDLLLAPVSTVVGTCTRLYIVPYGPLHLLPFHLLRLDGRYLIEHLEVVVLPTAALLLRPAVVCPPLYRWVGYSQHQSLPETLREATSLQRQWGGTVYLEEEAQFDRLVHTPCQVLHIAAHGVHSVDHYFDQSSLQLAEGAVTSDDILQAGAICELVTLSTCESGIVTVAPGEELIGLGRALLYAGAGALVTSLWQVRDEASAELMPRFYEHLMQGKSKAAALREAILEGLTQDRTAHPAFWGAFQLMGDAAPLSGGSVMYPE